MNKKRLFLCANRKGFVSAYALMILSIFLLFTTMFTQKIITYAYLLKQEDAMMVDLYIVKSIQQKILEVEQNQNEKEEINDEQEASIEEKYNIEWDKEYHGVSIHFKWDNQEILVSFPWEKEYKRIQVTLQDHKTILDYVYIDSQKVH